MNLWGIPGVVSERIFGPPPEGYEQPDIGADLEKGLTWLKSFISTEDWLTRRINAARRLYSVANGRLDGGDDAGSFYDSDDLVGWYLFTAEALLEHPWNYDPTLGCRIITVIAALGRNLPMLQGVSGIEQRVQRLLDKGRKQPNGPLFELLVAAAYRRAGASVSFKEERPGQAQSHDLDVVLRGKHWAVECKRMETSEYGEAERMRMRLLWEKPCRLLVEKDICFIANVEFSREVSKVPENYLLDIVREYIRSGKKSLTWIDEVSAGSCGLLDLKPLQKALEDNDILSSGSRILELLSGRYLKNTPAIWVTRAKTVGRYIESCDFAVVLRWSCNAPAAIDAKARSITTRVSRATQQLPDATPSIIHVGIEAVDGDNVEEARLKKTYELFSRFDPQGKSLEYVYLNLLVPESPPEELFALDETVMWFGIRPQTQRPLETGNLVNPDAGIWREGVHWIPIEPT